VPKCDPRRLDPEDVNILIERWAPHRSGSPKPPMRSCCPRTTGGGKLSRRPALDDRRKNAAIVAITNDPNPPAAADRLIDSADPAMKSGAATATAMLARHGGAGSWAPMPTRVGDD
jgi:hypothetical protein